jgi:hypothetical protein
MRSRLNLRPEMPRESIKGLCLPVALAILHKMELFLSEGTAFIDVENGKEIQYKRLNPELSGLFSFLNEQLPFFKYPPNMFIHRNREDSENDLAEYLDKVRGFLSTFCEEPPSEISPSPPQTE